MSASQLPAALANNSLRVIFMARDSSTCPERRVG
jgi:hypothetical protein